MAAFPSAVGVGDGVGVLVGVGVMVCVGFSERVAVGVLVGVDAAVETGVWVGVGGGGTGSDVGVNVASGVGVLVGCVTVVGAGPSSHAHRTTAIRQGKPTQVNSCMVLRDVICNLSSPLLWGPHYCVPHLTRP